MKDFQTSVPRALRRAMKSSSDLRNVASSRGSSSSRPRQLVRYKAEIELKGINYQLTMRT